MSNFETLGEISDISLGRDFRGSIKADKDGEILVLQPKEVFSESIEDVVRVRRDKVGACQNRLLRPGDILCSIRHKFISMVVKEEWLTRPVIANSGLFIIRLNSNEFLPEYVSAFINCYFERQEFQDIMERQEQAKIKEGKKPSVRLLTKNTLSSIPIPKKSMEEQDEIVAEIRAAQSKYRALINGLNEEKKYIEDKYRLGVKDYCATMDRIYNDIVAK